MSYLEKLYLDFYPLELIHQFGVNGKASGAVYALGEIGQALGILHGAQGCAWHYRYSARRRHAPLFPLFSSELTEKEIIFGGEEKLLRTIEALHQEYQPQIIVVIPTPTSDIIGDDIVSLARQATRLCSIPVIAARSEVFSHRDTSYTLRRMKEVSKQKFNQEKNIEFDITGCGYSEVLISMVEQLMEPAEPIPLTVNIESIGWGTSGQELLREILKTLGKAGVSFNSFFPSTSLSSIRKLPSAALNIIWRRRWAVRMQELFGTPFLQVNSTGKYSGLKGIRIFYEDIASKLGLSEVMEKVLNEEEAEAASLVESDLEALKAHSVYIVSQHVQLLPQLIRKYSQDYKLNIVGVAVLTNELTRSIYKIPDEVYDNFFDRVKSSLAACDLDKEILINPDWPELAAAASKAEAIVGCDFSVLEKTSVPVIHTRHDEMSLSYAFYVRSIKKMCRQLENRKSRSHLISNRFDFDKDYYPLLSQDCLKAAREVWAKMWIRNGGKH